MVLYGSRRRRRVGWGAELVAVAVPLCGYAANLCRGHPCKLARDASIGIIVEVEVGQADCLPGLVPELAEVRPAQPPFGPMKTSPFGCGSAKRHR